MQRQASPLQQQAVEQALPRDADVVVPKVALPKQAVDRDRLQKVRLTATLYVLMGVLIPPEGWADLEASGARRVPCPNCGSRDCNGAFLASLEEAEK